MDMFLYMSFLCMIYNYCFIFTGLVLSALLTIFIHGHNYLLAYKLGMITRTLMTGVIYEKVGVVTCFLFFYWYNTCVLLLSCTLITCS